MDHLVFNHALVIRCDPVDTQLGVNGYTTNDYVH